VANRNDGIVPSSELIGGGPGCVAVGRESDISWMRGLPNADRTWPNHERASAALPVMLCVCGVQLGLSALMLISLGQKSADQ
jgi:hypothetical protein